MEWYFASDSVAKDQETPEHLLQRGVPKLGNCGLPNKWNIQTKESTTNELSIDQESFIYELNKEHTYGWTAWGEFPMADWNDGSQEASLQRNGPLGDEMDYQLDGLNEMNQMEDIFLSIRENPLDMRNPYGNVGTVPESGCSTVSFDNLSTDMVTESPSFLMEPSDMDGMSYSDFSQSEAPVLTVKTTDELCTSPEEAEPVGKDTSLEARVLGELEFVMAKMPQNARICFRDALYRLAKWSKQNHLLTHRPREEISMDMPQTICHKTLRSGEAQPMELATNAIDRTIANFMFNTFSCNRTDLSSLTSLSHSDESVTEEKSHDYSSKMSKIIPQYPAASSQDAEVPIFGGYI